MKSSASKASAKVRAFASAKSSSNSEFLRVLSSIIKTVSPEPTTKSSVLAITSETVGLPTPSIMFKPRSLPPSPTISKSSWPEVGRTSDPSKTSKMPSLSSSMSIKSITPSSSVSIISASRKSTSCVKGTPPPASPSTSGSANAPVAIDSLTSNPSSTRVPFCSSNTSKRPSPSMSVVASDRPVAVPVRPASTVSLPPSLSESVSTKSASPSPSVSTGVRPIDPAPSNAPASPVGVASYASSNPSWSASAFAGAI